MLAKFAMYLTNPSSGSRAGERSSESIVMLSMALKSSDSCDGGRRRLFGGLDGRLGCTGRGMRDRRDFLGVIVGFGAICSGPGTG